MKKLGTLALSSAMMLSCTVPAFAAEPTVTLDTTNGVAVAVEGDNGSVGVSVAKDPAEVAVNVSNDYADVDVDVTEAATTVDVAAGDTTVSVGVGEDVYEDADGNLHSGVTSYVYNEKYDSYNQVEVIPDDHFEVGGFFKYLVMGYVSFNKDGLTVSHGVGKDETTEEYKNLTNVVVDNNEKSVTVTNTNEYVDTSVEVTEGETKVNVNDTSVDVSTEKAEVVAGDVKVAVAKDAAAVTVKDVSVAVNPEEAEINTPTVSLKVSKTAIKNAIAKIQALFAKKVDAE